MPNDVKFPEDYYYTTTEVAQLFRVSKMTIYRLMKSGDIDAIRIGRNFRIKAVTLHSRYPELTERTWDV